MSATFNGGCGCGCGGTSLCLGAPSIYACPCEDKGLVNYGASVAVRDGQFCDRRLANTPGLLQCFPTSSGGYQIFFTNEPSPSLGTFNVTQGAEFGDLVAINADGKMRALDFPNVANLFLRTNSAGQLYADTLPTVTIPDPLTVNTVNVVTVNTTALNASGAVNLSGLATGTITQIVGIDNSGNLIQGGTSSGVQSSMFYEAAASPSATTPNANAVAGSNLVIGNQLFDSGGSLIGVVDGQTLKVLVAGPYRIDWGGEVVFNGLRRGPGLGLTINGVLVNPGNSSSINTGDTSSPRWMNCAGFEYRNLAVNDVIRIQLSPGSGTQIDVYSVRVGFMKTG